MKIYCSQGPNINERYKLNDGVINIGRSASNDIMINDLTCSRKHLVIVVEGSLVILTNEKPMNPVHINGRVMQERTALRSGDIISLGETKLLVLEDDEEPVPENEESYEVHDTVNIDVRQALRDVMAKDMLRVSTEATTRIKQSDLVEISGLWAK